ncbi:MAG: hypothetical protein ACO1G9_06990 [Bacteroidota bacterium]
MIHKLTDLNRQEKELYEQVERIEGPLEIRRIKVNENGISDKYKSIHSEYSNLATESIEALKRAVFLQWYSVVEPFEFTGLNELDAKDCKNNFLLLEVLLLNDDVDLELLEMIKFYYSISDWCFLNYLKDSRVLKLLKGNDDDGINKNVLESTKDRGLMGDYWNSLMNNKWY